ncbi:MAG: PAS domain S-box protein [Verrucomicrobia bacterium]|nr:PAS domain S-box protein [Verrucomicrobiota bacterium]
MNQSRILIVEDEAIVAADLAVRLTHLGYHVLGAVPNGEQALALAAEILPDLVLMDIHLQGATDGITAAQELRSALRLPVVFLTAYGEGITFQRAKEAEPYGYILKPFEDRELRIVIEIALYKHQAERSIRESEERHRTIIETAMDGFWLVDVQGRLLEVNAAYCQMSGYSVAELLSMRVSDLEADETAANVVARIQQLIEQGEDRFESTHCRKDGSHFDVEVSIKYRPIEGGRVVTFLRDITKRKWLEVYRNMESEILQLLQKPEPLQDLIQRVVSTLKARTGVDAVGIRLQDGEDFPYFAQEGFSKDFLLTENTLLGSGAERGLCGDQDGKPCLECTCGLVISGQSDSSNPPSTRGGQPLDQRFLCAARPSARAESRVEATHPVHQSRLCLGGLGADSKHRQCGRPDSAQRPAQRTFHPRNG